MHPNQQVASRLTLGTAQMGMLYGLARKNDRVSRQESLEILDHAALVGVNTIDTAFSYGDAEEVLCQAGVSRFDVITKLPRVPGACPSIEDWVYKVVQGSLARLSLQQFEAVLLHEPAQLLEPFGPALFSTLEDLKRRGLIRRIGISVYEYGEAEKLAELYSVDIVQVPFNILDDRLLVSGWLERAAAANVQVHARSIFLQGLLLMEPSQRPQQFNRWSDIWSTYDSWLARTGVTPLEACLRYVLSYSEFDRVIVGVDSVFQLEQIMAVQLPGEPMMRPRAIGSCDVNLLNPVNWSN